MAKAEHIKEQLKNILIRLSSLEEQQEHQRVDDIPALRRSFQTFEAKMLECDKRRQDQFLALQENNVLLLQRLLSFKNDVTNIRSECQSKLEQAQKDLFHMRDRLSLAEECTLELGNKMNIDASRKPIKVETNGQVHVECGDRIDAIHKQIDETNKRISKFRMVHVEKMRNMDRKIEERHRIHMIEIKKMLAKKLQHITNRNVSMLQSEVEKIHTSCSIKMKGLDEKMEEMLLEAWQQVVVFQKEMKIGVENVGQALETKNEQTYETLNQKLLDTVNSKVKDFEKKMEAEKWVHGEEAKKDLQESIYSETQTLESKLNAKFQENYDSQMKLLSITLGRQCQQEVNTSFHNISEKQLEMRENMKLHQESMQKELDRRFQESGIDSLEKHVLAACNEQRIQSLAEIDQKLQTHSLETQKYMQNEIKKNRKECNIDFEKRLQRTFCEQRVLLQAEADQKLQICNMQTHKALQNIMKNRNHELSVKDVEKQVQKAFREQRLLLQVEADQNLQIHNMQTHNALQNELEKKFKELGISNLEKLIQKACSEQRLFLISEVDQKIQTQMQMQKDMRLKMEMIQDKFQEIQAFEMARKIKVIQDWLNKDLQSHLEKMIQEIFNSQIKTNRKETDRQQDKSTRVKVKEEV